MVVALIARYTNPSARTVIAGTIQELYALLHDAHEAVTGDIPTTWKSPDMRILQEQLDDRIYRALGLVRPGPDLRSFIHMCDEQALLAEAQIVGAPGVYERIQSERRGIVASHDALVAVGDVQSHHFTQVSAAAFYFGWVKRLIVQWGDPLAVKDYEIGIANANTSA